MARIRFTLETVDGSTIDLFNFTDGTFNQTERWGEQDRNIPNRLEVSASVTLHSGYEDSFSATMTTNQPLVRELLKEQGERNHQNFTGMITITDAGGSPTERTIGFIELNAINDVESDTPDPQISISADAVATGTIPLSLIVTALTRASSTELDLIFYEDF